MDDGRVFACQPSYAGGSPHSHRAFWVGHTRPGGLTWNRANLSSGGGSLLAMTFNNYWAQALTAQEAHEAGRAAAAAGQPVTANPHAPEEPGDLHAMWIEGHQGRPNIQFFAMLHDDIVPETGWLDTLLEDLLANDADLVSAVVPIKDLLGLTSTAIDNPNDEFVVDRRLTMTEVHRLPEVFSAADCGFFDRWLLVNSGCWICRFDRPWRYEIIERFGAPFTIRDRMRRDDKTGLWIADAASEDWGFSRNVQKLGGRVLATRRVKLEHHGVLPYTNRHPWGDWEADQASASGQRVVRQPVLPAPQEDPHAVLRSPHWHASMDAPHYRSEELADVPGWLTDDEGRLLSKLAQGRRVLEVGCYCGRSTVWLARTAREVYSVDTFDSSYCPTRGDTRAEFDRTVQRYGLAHKVTARRGNFEDLAPSLPGEFDLILVDASHDHASVARDIRLCLPLLALGGRMVFHDYGRPADPGVKMAVDEAFGPQTPKVGSLAVVTPLGHQVRGLRADHAGGQETADREAMATA